MTTTAAPAAPKSRRRFLPQFSLRALLVVVTLSAIGTALWYRWPIEETVDLAEDPLELVVGTRMKEFPSREVRTVRRAWGGELIRHGPTRQYNFQGKLLSETIWQENRKHGLSHTWRPDGTLRAEGMYFNDLKDGEWWV